SPWSSKHRVEPRLRSRVGSAAKQDYQQARAIAGDRAAGLNTAALLPPRRPALPSALLSPFNGSSPRPSCPRLLPSRPVFFCAQFALAAPQTRHRNDGRVDGRNFTLVFNRALHARSSGRTPRRSLSRGRAAALARRGSKGLSARSPASQIAAGRYRCVAQSAAGTIEPAGNSALTAPLSWRSHAPHAEQRMSRGSFSAENAQRRSLSLRS